MKEIVDNYPGSANLLVLVLDFETLDCEEAVATAFSQSGCRIQSSKLGQIDKLVGLRLSGLDKMIKGRVSEVLEDGVQVTFEFKDTSNQEKRKEQRRQVSISAQVSVGKGHPPLRCRIVDASLSGCRLTCDTVDALPDDIILKIPGMDLPVKGRIVWRANGFAGVKMMWQFSRKTEVIKAEMITPPSLADKVRKPRRNGAAAGPGTQYGTALGGRPG